MVFATKVGTSSDEGSIMILPIAIGTGLLAVLNDDEPPDFQELFQRAVLFKNPEVILDCLDSDQRLDFHNWIIQWTDASKSLEELRDRLRLKIFFLGGDKNEDLDSDSIFLFLPSFGGKAVISKEDLLDHEEDEDESLKSRLQKIKRKSLEVVDTFSISTHHSSEFNKGRPTMVLSWDKKRILLGGNLYDDMEPWLIIVDRPSRESLDVLREESIAKLKAMF
jgi:hypothetical protein